MSETKHTPLPWRVEAATGYVEGWADIRPSGLAYIPIRSPWREDAWDDNGIALANAQLIVISVNAHPKVEELLETILRNVNSNPRLWAEQLVAKAREVEAALKGEA